MIEGVDLSGGVIATEPAELCQSAELVAGLIRGDFDLYDGQVKQEHKVTDDLANNRDITWNTIFPEGNEIRPKALDIRSVFRQGYSAYNVHDQRHKKVKDHFKAPDYSDRGTRRFLRRLVSGIHESNPQELKIDKIAHKIRSSLPRVNVNGSLENVGKKIEGNLNMVDICELILNGTISLDPQTYLT